VGTISDASLGLQKDGLEQLGGVEAHSGGGEEVNWLAHVIVEDRK
jgi:hypothetical protein